MFVYALKNSNGQFLSMSGGLTKDWFQASKFPESEIEKRMKYVDGDFKLVTYTVEEVTEQEG